MLKAVKVIGAVVVLWFDRTVVTRTRDWFEPNASADPDFDDVEIINDGQTLRLGIYEVGAQRLLDDQLSPAVTRYAALLLELHKEIQADRSEGEPAELLRDAMDPVWWELTGDEVLQMEAYLATLDS